MKPRDLPVYKEPVLPEINIDNAAGWSIAPEGFVTKDSSLLGNANEWKLPAFDNLNQQRYFIDVFLNDKKPVSWTAIPSHTWIRLSDSNGSLAPEWGKNQVRIWVDVDWRKAPIGDKLTGRITFKGGGKQMEVTIQGRQLQKPGGLTDKTCIENNGVVSIHAASWMKTSIDGGISYWNELPGLGYTGMALQAFPRIDIRSLPSDTGLIKKTNSRVEFSFYSFTAAAPKVTVFTLPTQPLNNKFSMRYAVSIDDGPLAIVDFKTVGRSEEWKNNVLSNRAERTIQGPLLQKGLHTLNIYCVDPGVILDEIRIDLGGLKKAYSTIPETKLIGRP
jgi:hypothetical protein